MLGLGDIVIPGLFIGFLIRFGRYRALSTMLPASRHINKNYRNPYICPSLTAYVFSLSICGACLILFNSAQPALLYIVPSLLLTTFIVGSLKGDLK